MEATPNLLAGNNCYPDSGANNLVPHDLKDLSIGFEQWSQQNSDRQWKRVSLWPHIGFYSANKLRNSTCSKIHKKPNIVSQFAEDKIMYLLDLTQMFALWRTKQKEASYSKGGYKDCVRSLCSRSTLVPRSNPDILIQLCPKKSIQSKCPFSLTC